MLAAAAHQIPVKEYAPARVKQSITGNGCATKEQMQRMIQRLLHLQSCPPSDSADALSLAICHWHTVKGGRIFTSSSSGRWTLKDIERLQEKRLRKAV